MPALPAAVPASQGSAVLHGLQWVAHQQEAAHGAGAEHEEHAVSHSLRNPAAKGRADRNQAPIAEAIELLIYPLPVMRLNTAGNGVEDLLFPLTIWAGVEGHRCRVRTWYLCECKRPRNKRGEVTPSQYTKAQKEWREKTEGWPRITVTSAQDAVDQIRELTR